jgi:hypothetical protein
LKQKQNALFDHSVGAKPMGLGLREAAPPAAGAYRDVRSDSMRLPVRDGGPVARTAFKIRQAAASMKA